MASREASKESLELGRIGGPYGIKGWVHVQSFTSPPERLLKYREWTLSTASAGKTVHQVAEGRVHGDGVVARLEGIEDRDRAALLQGSMVHVARSALPKLRKREYYQADLIGLGVTNLEGVRLGAVSHFVETPGGDVMIVKAQSGQEHWVPANRQHLTKVDLDSGQIVVDWPATLEEWAPNEDEHAGDDEAHETQEE
jgi:16S rRNA processing protein RimM